MVVAAPYATMVTINIKTLKGDKFTMEVDPSSTVSRAPRLMCHSSESNHSCGGVKCVLLLSVCLG